MHLDPAVTDAFNALFLGHKWWVVLPKDLYEFEQEFTCDKECSDVPKYERSSENEDKDVQNILGSSTSIKVIEVQVFFSYE